MRIFSAILWVIGVGMALYSLIAVEIVLGQHLAIVGGVMVLAGIFILISEPQRVTRDRDEFV